MAAEGKSFIEEIMGTWADGWKDWLKIAEGKRIVRVLDGDSSF